LAIAKKEAKIQLRYRIVWLNFALTPFFIISPWILTAKSFSVEFGEAVLIGPLMWYWLNQYFFGVQEAFEEEREEGTLVSIALSPISLLKFLIGKGLWMLIECVYITAVTMLISLDAWDFSSFISKDAPPLCSLRTAYVCIPIL